MYFIFQFKEKFQEIIIFLKYWFPQCYETVKLTSFWNNSSQKKKTNMNIFWGNPTLFTGRKLENISPLVYMYLWPISLKQNKKENN